MWRSAFTSVSGNKFLDYKGVDYGILFYRKFVLRPLFFSPSVFLHFQAWFTRPNWYYRISRIIHHIQIFTTNGNQINPKVIRLANLKVMSYSNSKAYQSSNLKGYQIISTLDYPNPIPKGYEFINLNFTSSISGIIKLDSIKKSSPSLQLQGSTNISSFQNYSDPFQIINTNHSMVIMISEEYLLS